MQIKLKYHWKENFVLFTAVIERFGRQLKISSHIILCVNFFLLTQLYNSFVNNKRMLFSMETYILTEIRNCASLEILWIEYFVSYTKYTHVTFAMERIDLIHLVVFMRLLTSWTLTRSLLLSILSCNHVSYSLQCSSFLGNFVLQFLWQFSWRTPSVLYPISIAVEAECSWNVVLSISFNFFFCISSSMIDLKPWFTGVTT